jgi:glycogen synthase
MRVLMLGWEFPPFISGGLGTACYGLTKAMSQLGTEVLFLLPKPIETQLSSHVKMLAPQGAPVQGSYSYRMQEFEHVVFRTIDAGLTPYQTPEQYTTKTTQHSTTAQKEAAALAVAGIQASATPVQTAVPTGGGGAHYGGDMFQEVERYARLATLIAGQEQFDVIHAHDWMTYRAGIAVSAMTGKPLVVHVHSTEFDRSGEHVNQPIYDIERQGMHFAQKIIAVSALTRSICVARYGVPAEKVQVVYNAIDFNGHEPPQMPPDIGRDEKLVLFLGRITMQKGPEYFLGAAKKVLEVMDNVRFIMAGWGDMIRKTIELAAQMGIGHKVLFTGFLRGKDVDRAFQMADLYVMPSVSEPFGIAPLEAMSNDVPVIISKQSGVSEILSHALKVDFWDVNEMANKIVAVLRHPPLQRTLREHGKFEVRKLTWSGAAQKCVRVYEQAVAIRNGHAPVPAPQA